MGTPFPHKNIYGYGVPTPLHDRHVFWSGLTEDTPYDKAPMKTMLLSAGADDILKFYYFRLNVWSQPQKMLYKVHNLKSINI